MILFSSITVGAAESSVLLINKLKGDIYILAHLNQRRPLDKVFHSIIVATEILLARSRFLRQQETKLHGPSEVLRNKTVTVIVNWGTV
jgi:hypothetical protein